MANLPIGFIDSVKDLETMRRVCKFAVREYGVSYLLFDYMGLMIPSRNFRGSRYDRASMVSEGLKELAGELNVPVVALSQLRRKYKEEKSAAQVIEGNEVEPSLDMLKESGSIENDADTVIFLWGEKAKEGEETAIREIRGKIAKQRNGKLDRFELRFAPDIFTFKSMSQLTAYRSAEPEF
jgi:replicative DNA helicase